MNCIREQIALILVASMLAAERPRLAWYTRRQKIRTATNVLVEKCGCVPLNQWPLRDWQKIAALIAPNCFACIGVFLNNTLMSKSGIRQPKSETACPDEKLDRCRSLIHIFLIFQEVQ